MKTHNPTGIAYQDMKFVDDELVASGVMRNQLAGAVDWLDTETLQPRRRLTLGRTETWTLWTREGMTIRNGQLFLMPHDGDGKSAQIDVFQLTAMKDLVLACAGPDNSCLAPPRERQIATIAPPPE
jgi:hypothetical protein